MQREYLILMQGEKSCGAVRLDTADTGIKAEINMDVSCGLAQEEVFKAYAIMLESNEIKYLGVLDGFMGEYGLEGIASPVGIVITRKQTDSGEEKFFCCGAEEGRLKETEESFSGKALPYKAEQEGEKTINCTTEVTPQPADVCTASFEREYLRTAEEKLKVHFPDYEWQKINGYFLPMRNRILEYIMSNSLVYGNIMKNGYYHFGLKNDGDVQMFVVAVPSEDKIPFENCKEYAFEIGSDGGCGGGLCCITAGVDGEGEFFCRKKEDNV